MSSDNQDDSINNEVDALSQELPPEETIEDMANAEDIQHDSIDLDPEPIKANKKVKAPRRGGGFFSFLTFLIALAALAASAYTYWQQQEFTKSANINLSAAEEASAKLKTEIKTEVSSSLSQFASDKDQLVNDITRSNKKVQRDLRIDVETLDARISETETQIVGLKGFSDAAKKAYLKAEIEYFLQMANNRIDLAQDARTALAALEAADERLSLFGDSSLVRVRAQVIDEIQALKAIDYPDIQKLALTLASIAKQVPSLPLRMDDEKDYFQEEIKLKEGTGFRVGMSNVWRNMKGTLDKLVEVRDATPSDVPLMSVEDLSLLYVNLDVQLQSARLASLKGDAENYQISIDSAEKLLSVYFDAEKPQVQAVIKSLLDIKDANLSPVLPDIKQSLLMLREQRSADSAEIPNE